MIIISVGDGAFYLPGYSNRQKMPTSAKLSETISNIFSIALVKSVHVTRGSVLWVEPKFNSWSLIPASFGRFFHAISVRLRPIVLPKCIAQWVSRFQVFQMLSPIQYQQVNQV